LSGATFFFYVIVFIMAIPTILELYTCHEGMSFLSQRGIACVLCRVSAGGVQFNCLYLHGSGR